ncbi:Annexin [Fasciolopsis buskii]|uniref:Annexin n=1 Tax=Fasciolopsis buskii TaxID=27845 RepID=A0A8E0VFC9_9TREM|nr:Annexin [Fasciolopsis buski]
MSRQPRHRILIGPNGETYHPTLKAPASIDVEEDCKKLRAAMKGLGTDEATLIDILGHRNLDQRMEIYGQYKSLFGKDLMKELHSELSGHFRSAMKMLLMEPEYICARALYKAMKGAGTKESVIVEVLCTATNNEIRAIKSAYLKVLSDEGQKDASRTLESDIEDDLSGCLKHLCIALLQADRDELSESQVQQVLKQGVRSVVNMELVQKDIEELYDAGTGRLGTDESTFIRILVKRSVWHLYMVNKRYEEQYGKSLMKAIESETSGDFESALKLTLFTCLSRPQAYAALLHDCMAGLGTRDETLIRIIVSRCEVSIRIRRETYLVQSISPHFILGLVCYLEVV